MLNPFLVKKYAAPLVRWGAAGTSVLFFLTYEDLPAILLETPYGQPVGWRDVGVAVGLAAPRDD